MNYFYKIILKNENKINNFMKIMNFNDFYLKNNEFQSFFNDFND